MQYIITFTLIILAFARPAEASQSFPDILKAIKPSIVAIGNYKKTRSPARLLLGTGFVVADGNHVVTNAHVIDSARSVPDALLSVFIGRERNLKIYSAKVVAYDREHDLAIVRFDGPAQPILEIGDSSRVQEGEIYAFSGFPIGQILGQYPVTHRGMIAAITPNIIPMDNAKQLNSADLKKLREPFVIFQLDATAYPGNSGSPLFDMKNGRVIGVMNKVYVKTAKEKVLSDPSGISYAIPSKYLLSMLQQAGIKTKNQREMR
ncbi:serine protease [Pleionea sp. CnH1-48]|uniref:S1 family peptidase n=1 Tax=Pleionea sp. CnH1-48 TaxID=2954494 RepID=UPI00209798F7|nr:serine protease [Pleionea sp. CnH1-48]MCO7226240.1 serine protease [Pleionea sp. CnH1-48]